MKCPHCQNELKVPGRAWHNASAYDKRVAVTTECCGGLVVITPVRSYDITTAWGKEDDWGIPTGPDSKEAYARMDRAIVAEHDRRAALMG